MKISLYPTFVPILLPNHVIIFCYNNFYITAITNYGSLMRISKV